MIPGQMLDLLRRGAFLAAAGATTVKTLAPLTVALLVCFFSTPVLAQDQDELESSRFGYFVPAFTIPN